MRSDLVTGLVSLAFCYYKEQYLDGVIAIKRGLKNEIFRNLKTFFQLLYVLSFHPSQGIVDSLFSSYILL